MKSSRIFRGETAILFLYWHVAAGARLFTQLDEDKPDANADDEHEQATIEESVGHVQDCCVVEEVANRDLRAVDDETVEQAEYDEVADRDVRVTPSEHYGRGSDCQLPDPLADPERPLTALLLDTDQVLPGHDEEGDTNQPPDRAEVLADGLADQFDAAECKHEDEADDHDERTRKEWIVADIKGIQSGWQEVELGPGRSLTTEAGECRLRTVDDPTIGSALPILGLDLP